LRQFEESHSQDQLLRVSETNVANVMFHTNCPRECTPKWEHTMYRFVNWPLTRLVTVICILHSSGVNVEGERRLICLIEKPYLRSHYGNG